MGKKQRKIFGNFNIFLCFFENRVQSLEDERFSDRFCSLFLFFHFPFYLHCEAVDLFLFKLFSFFHFVMKRVDLLLNLYFIGKKKREN